MDDNDGDWDIVGQYINSGTIWPNAQGKKFFSAFSLNEMIRAH